MKKCVFFKAINRPAAQSCPFVGELSVSTVKREEIQKYETNGHGQKRGWPFVVEVFRYPPESRMAVAEFMSSRNEQQMPSIPERELLRFVSAASELFDIWEPRLLKEIWLDQAASMDFIPGPTSSQWQLVTLAAWARLAQRLMEPLRELQMERNVSGQVTGMRLR